MMVGENNLKKLNQLEIKMRNKIKQSHIWLKLNN